MLERVVKVGWMRNRSPASRAEMELALSPVVAMLVDMGVDSFEMLKGGSEGEMVGPTAN